MRQQAPCGAKERSTFAPLPRPHQSGSLEHYRRRGNAIVEFSLVGMVLMTTLFGFINFSHAFFVRSLLRYSVAEGMRYGITGQTRTGMSHAESVKAVVQESSLGLLKSSTNAATIKVRYYLPDGITPATMAGNNLLEVAVEDYPLIQLAPLFWSDINITNRLVDVMEPFNSPPTGGGGGGGTACIGS